MAKDLVKTLADLKEKEALQIVQERLKAGDPGSGVLWRNTQSHHRYGEAEDNQGSGGEAYR
jgi:hypothetical protein